MPAKKEQMERFFAHVEQELHYVGFFPNEDMREHMMEVIRGYLTRTRPTDREIRMLHGVLATMSGRRLGGKPAHEPGTKGGTGAKARKRARQEPPEA
jgi:tRNA C32,U32 (ribose-2'-O)-methylase TrmJ